MCRHRTLRLATTGLAALALTLLLLLGPAATPWSSASNVLAEENEPEPTPTPTSTPPPAPTATPTATATPQSAPAEDEPPDESGSYPLPDDQPADYPLLSGHFYSQAVPSAPLGFGFSVTDAGGIPLWREYQRRGGLARLGYPLSRRFVHDGAVVQAFQGGLLRWRAERDEAALVALKSFGELPAEAAEPEPPHRLGGSAARQPWSGWWWPVSRLVRGPYLFDSDGPLAKYDLFVARNGRDDPGTLEWEQETHGWIGLAWAGHCNGWAAAALLEEEPTRPREIDGLSFSVGDLKGLLTAYHFADSAAWLDGGAEQELTPLQLHHRLLTWLGKERRGFILTFRPVQDAEVWSYPAYRFELTMSPEPNSEATHVRAVVWLADNDVEASFVGLQPWRGEGQVYEYRLFGPREAPTGGEWVGASLGGGFSRPALLWYPDARVRNLERDLASPNLEYRTIRRIVRP